jgi:hypothetical protein
MRELWRRLWMRELWRIELWMQELWQIELGGKLLRALLSVSR